MLTILCSPKPFVGEAARNQLNAMRSWRAIDPDVEIIIFGVPQGAAEAAAETGSVLVPEIACSPSGAPSFNAMVEYAWQHGRHDQQAYVNADILLDESILRAVQMARLRFETSLLVGERVDLVQGTSIDAQRSGWIEELLLLAETGRLTAHGPTGVDYFAFIRGMWSDLPPVFMGRAMCDQALLHYCLRQSIPVIDATLAVVAVHQYHDYQHVRGGSQEVFSGEDRNLMAREHGLHHGLPTVADADWRFADNGAIEPNRYRRRLLRRMELHLRYHIKLGTAAMALRTLQYVGGREAVQPCAVSLPTILHAWLLTRRLAKPIEEFEQAMDVMTSRKPRVGVFSKYYPEYREGVLSRLANDPSFDFVFLAGPPPSGSFIQAATHKAYQFRPISVHSVSIPGTRNSISFLGAPIISLLRRDYDALILTNDILELDVWLCCALSYLFDVPICIWGQGLSRPSTRFRDALGTTSHHWPPLRSTIPIVVGIIG